MPWSHYGKSCIIPHQGKIHFTLTHLIIQEDPFVLRTLYWHLARPSSYTSNAAVEQSSKHIHYFYITHLKK